MVNWLALRPKYKSSGDDLRGFLLALLRVIRGGAFLRLVAALCGSLCAVPGAGNIAA